MDKLPQRKNFDSSKVIPQSNKDAAIKFSILIVINAYIHKRQLDD